MRILLFVHQFFPNYRAGTEVLTLELSRRLRENDHQVSIVTGEGQLNIVKKPDCLIEKYSYDGFSIFRLKRRNRRGFYSGMVTFHFEDKQRLELVMGLVKEVKPDIVHFIHIKGFPVQAISEIRNMGISVIFTPTDFWAVCPTFQLYKTYEQNVCMGMDEECIFCLKCYKNLPTVFLKLLVWLANTPFSKVSSVLREIQALKLRKREMIRHLNNTDYILPATRFLADMLIKHGVKESKIKVIPYGLDINLFPDQIVKTLPRKVVIGFIGSLVKTKGAHVLLESLRYLQAEYEKFKVEIYGEFDNSSLYCRSLRKLRERVKQAEVEFKGTFSFTDQGFILSGIDLLVIPSIWWEDFPLVLCAALIAKKPVLVSDLGGLTEMVKEGIDGFYFKPGNALELAGRIKDFLIKPGLWDQLKKRSNWKPKNMKQYTIEIEDIYFKSIKS